MNQAAVAVTTKKSIISRPKYPTEFNGYQRSELAKMFGVGSSFLLASDLISQDMAEYKRRRRAAYEVGLVGNYKE
jgi:hypothetical protein